ncbi:putative calvin cycle protein CP12 [Helianthus debilis subsp. tardiflorus]
MPTTRTHLRPLRAVPNQGLSDKIASSIANAQGSCADDPKSDECVAAWNEVEELSAASSHAREKAKDSVPLEIVRPPLMIYICLNLGERLGFEGGCVWGGGGGGGVEL